VIRDMVLLLMKGSKLNRHFEEDLRARIPMTQENLMSWTGMCVKCGKIQ
jgi:hypothetical protein